MKTANELRRAVAACLPHAAMLLAFLALATGDAAAQDKRISAQPIRFMVAFAPGGGADVIARFLADKMGSALGQSVVVENRPGAAGVIAARQVVGLEPNGLTVLVASNPLLISEIIKPSGNFQMERDLAPVASVAPQSIVITAAPELPANSLKELMALAKTKNLNYATTGAGSLSHLAVAYLLMSQPGVKMQHIPFSGSAPALTAVMSGQVEVASSTVPPTLGLISGGKLKAIGIASDKRSGMLPNVPTYAESGFPALPLTAWTGFFVSKGTPKEMVERLSKAITEVAALPEAQAKFRELGFETTSSDATKFTSELAAETKIWTDVVSHLDPGTLQ